MQSTLEVVLLSLPQLCRVSPCLLFLGRAAGNIYGKFSGEWPQTSDFVRDPDGKVRTISLERWKFVGVTKCHQPSNWGVGSKIGRSNDCYAHWSKGSKGFFLACVVDQDVTQVECKEHSNSESNVHFASAGPNA